jgi:hypothetical protein
MHGFSRGSSLLTAQIQLCLISAVSIPKQNAVLRISCYTAAPPTPDLFPQDIIASFSSRVFTDQNPGLDCYLETELLFLRGADPYAKYHKPYPLH